MKVTYLFGAGASCKCLPLVMEIPERLGSFIEFMELERERGIERSKLAGFPGNYFKEDEDFLNYAKELHKQVQAHHSIDTYAKKLFLTSQRDNYLKLKVILSCFFLYEEWRNSVDARYDGFFASILGAHDTDFPSHVRIISWNYDSQFERAYSNYSKQSSLSINQTLLGLYPSKLDSSNYHQRFSIFKLNGTTAFRENGEDDMRAIVDKIEISVPEWAGDVLFDYYRKAVFGRNEITPLLSFAWESEFRIEIRPLIQAAKTAIQNTDVLVIIGYSVPFFNRKVDKLMIAGMGGTLKKVYIQDKYPEAVEDSFTSIWTHHYQPEIKLIRSVEQFYLPPEL